MRIGDEGSADWLIVRASRSRGVYFSLRISHNKRAWFAYGPGYQNVRGVS